jgi:hypothetical protein
MAVQKPLVIINGQIQQIPAGDTLSAPSSVAEVDLVNASNDNPGAITVGCPVYVSGANSVDKARANASATCKVFGLVKDTSIASSSSGMIQTDGILVASTAQWDAVTGQTGGLTPGAIYYLDDTAAGKLTTTAPTSSGAYVYIVGNALSSTDLNIDTDRTGVLLA